MKLGIRRIKLQDLFIDQEIQRQKSDIQVKKILSSFDENALGIFIVSLRPEGKYHILDGQHRYYACIAMGINEVECEVHSGLSRQQESRLFLKYNRNRYQTKSIDNFKVSLQAEEPESIEVSKALNTFGLKVDRYNVQAPSTLFYIYRNYGSEILLKTLEFITKVWGKEALKSNVLKGVADFINLGSGKLNTEQFIMYMKKSTNRTAFNLIETCAKNYESQYRIRLKDAFCRILIEFHNKQYRDTDKWIKWDSDYIIS
jgi:hypothetical protein